MPRPIQLKNTHKGRCLTTFLGAAMLFYSLSPLSAQLFSNLQALGTRLPVGDPRIPSQTRGPKGIAQADLDADGRPDFAVANLDGTVTVYFTLSGGRFSAPVHLRAYPYNTIPAGTGGNMPPFPVPPTRITNELRGIICADLSGDGLADIATAAPYVGQVYLFINQGLRTFSEVTNITAWPGARNLAAGDFDGDGTVDFVVAGTTNGLRHYRGIGGGQFEIARDLTELAAAYDDSEEATEDFPRPVYAMNVYRRSGSNQDQLAVTHVQSDVIWILAADDDGALAIQGTIRNQEIHSLAVGAVTKPASSNAFDLVTAHRNLGTVEVHEGNQSTSEFEETPRQTLNIPGGPRALAIVDLDEDGWNDLVVVVRNFDRVLSYHNSNGTFVATSETPVGRSPRELITADFNADGFPDLAVMNRGSMDVSIINTFPGQSSFVSSDQIYPVDGEVAGLTVQDFNGDDRADVLQLHRASGEMSVRLADATGRLGPPTFYTIGIRPEAQSMADINNDGVLDIITANLSGSVSVRLGDGAGGFGPETTFELPADSRGALFALVPADFDGDGNIDLAAGYFDCRLAFFRGHGDGTFSYTTKHRFVYESRVMVAGDFDKDGDIDLAGAGWKGDIVIVENRGDLLDTLELTRQDFHNSDVMSARAMKTVDENADGDLDLLIGSEGGAVLYLGGPGLTFTVSTNSFPSVNFAASSVVTADFDGDGRLDMAAACQLLSCLTISTRDTNGIFLPVLTVDVPSGRFLAVGDLDGDGKPDLVGSGSVLWTALSSRKAEPMAAPLAEVSGRSTTHAVINEILAMNANLPLDLDGGRNSDWVELYNGTGRALSLAGWRLQLIAAGATNSFTFPATAFFGNGTRLLVVCSDNRRTPYHTGFKLPAEGGTLVLVDSSGAEVDRVSYEEQHEDVSYARYRDGASGFFFNAYPDPGRPNIDNGPLEPSLVLEGFDPATLQQGLPVRFYARGKDDAGIVSVSLVYRRLDIADDGNHRIFLFDDGLNEDGETLDGLFSGTLDRMLPPGAEIQFYIEVVDLSDQTIILPGDPVFADAGEPLRLYTLGSPSPTNQLSLEISEFVAANMNGLTDERGTNSDWVEIRNCSTSPVAVGGIGVAQSFFGNANRFVFPAGTVLAPGEHKVIYCDNSAEVGPLHAPFRINREGGTLVLTGLAGRGARTLVDTISYGSQTDDVALGRLGCGGDWRRLVPTPRASNVAGEWLGFVEPDRARFTFVYPTATTGTYTVEYTDSLVSPRWIPLQSVAGDGIEKVLTQYLSSKRFYRVRRDD